MGKFTNSKSMATTLTQAAVFISILALVLPITYASLSSTPVRLSTSLGDVVGVKKSAGPGVPKVEVFYGIPFARPPVGNLRFRAPEPAEPWGSEPLDGTVKPKACWQSIDSAFDRFSGVEMWNPNTERGEDCLYLNVWRPESASSSDTGSGDGDGSRGSHKSIMVWIYGGGFYAGSATLDVYDASQLAAHDDVIVVTIAYRIGPLGFLYLGDDNVPGNAGLRDQELALRWVKDNAANLGGSPDDITIFGESAGAASVGFHLVSPLSRGLFNRAIMQSTSPIASWAVMDTSKARNRSMTVAANVGCSGGNLTCLEAVNAETITDAQWMLSDLSWFAVPLGPVVDGIFLPQDPLTMVRAGNVHITDVILGVTKDEGIYFSLYAFSDVFQLQREGRMDASQFDRIMLKVAERNHTFQEQLVSTYKVDENCSPLNIVDAASGDCLFKCSVVDFAHEYTRVGGRVHMYSFEENFSSNPWPDWMGVPHGYEIEVVFGRPLAPGSNNTQSEKDLSGTVMELWTNFAKTGSPNADDSNAPWPEYTAGDKEYVIIRAGGLHQSARLRESQCQMWANFKEFPPASGSVESSSNGNIHRLPVCPDRNAASTNDAAGAALRNDAVGAVPV